MRRFEVLTLFPALFVPFVEAGLLGRAVRNGAIEIETVDLRGFGIGRHRAVDDVPYGGGAGMVLRPEPIFQAVRSREAEARKAGCNLWKVLITPQGRPFDQEMARELARREDPLLLICGRYEGFDERIRLGLADEEVSGGDYITQGGEVFAMAVIEAVTRLVPGVLGNPNSALEESFSGEGLEYPQYTRPAEFEGMSVPGVLLSGDHARIAGWRKDRARERTSRRRPDLGPAKNREPDCGQPREGPMGPK